MPMTHCKKSKHMENTSMCVTVNSISHHQLTFSESVGTWILIVLMMNNHDSLCSSSFGNFDFECLRSLQSSKKELCLICSSIWHQEIILAFINTLQQWIILRLLNWNNISHEIISPYKSCTTIFPLGSLLIISEVNVRLQAWQEQRLFTLLTS